MTRIYSDDEYAAALEQQDWDRFVASVVVSFDRYMAKLDELNYGRAGDSTPDVKSNAQHRNHVHAAAYAPGGYLGGAGTNGG